MVIALSLVGCATVPAPEREGDIGDSYKRSDDPDRERLLEDIPLEKRPKPSPKSRQVSAKLLKQIDNLILSGQYNQAGIMLEQILKSYPKSTELWLRMAKVYAGQGNCVGAQSALARGRIKATVPPCK